MVYRVVDPGSCPREIGAGLRYSLLNSVVMKNKFYLNATIRHSVITLVNTFLVKILLLDVCHNCNNILTRRGKSLTSPIRLLLAKRNRRSRFSAVVSFARHAHSWVQSFPRSLSSAKAGERESTPQAIGNTPPTDWIPASAGMTGVLRGIRFQMTPLPAFRLYIRSLRSTLSWVPLGSDNYCFLNPTLNYPVRPDFQKVTYVKRRAYYS